MPNGKGFKRHKTERVLKVKSALDCKATDGPIRYLTSIIPDGVLPSIAHFRFTWFNKCKRLAGLKFKCKLEVGFITKNCQLFLDEACLIVRRGKKRALIAVGHKILSAAYFILKDKTPYQETDDQALAEKKKALVIPPSPTWRDCEAGPHRSRAAPRCSMRGAAAG